WSDTHLAHVRDYVVDDKDNHHSLLELYRRILSAERVANDEQSSVQTLLKLSGIVRVFPGHLLRPRNRIYERVFDLAWVDAVQGSREHRYLVDHVLGGHPSPVERAAAGDTLARFGDPRFRSDAYSLPSEPLLGFVEIPAGLFLMGSDKERDP